jgi:UDPglucose 6-dehydrogenase
LRTLPELLAKHRNRGVEFTSDLASAVERSEAIFIAVGTPQGDTGAADLSYVEAVVSEIARHINSYKVIVEKSTVPVYTNEWISRVLHRHGVDPKASTWSPTPSSCAKAPPSSTSCIPTASWSAPTPSAPPKCCSASTSRSPHGTYYEQPGALPGRLQRGAAGQGSRHLGAERGDHQARLQRLPGAQNLLHQRRRQPGRIRRRRH